MTRIKRQREKMKQTLLGIALLIFVASMVVLLPYWFEKADCWNARQTLAFAERCEADPRCSLRPHDLNAVNVASRMAARTCDATLFEANTRTSSDRR